MFLAGRTLADLPGSWQAQTSLQAEPLAGDKAQTRNLDGDRLAALQVSNTGSQPLAASRQQRLSAKAGRAVNALFSIPGQQKSLSSLRSGELVLVKLEVTAKRNVPDALVVDLLPAGLELENQNLANSSASLQENGDAVQNLLNQMQQADIQHIEFRDDRFVAAVAVNEGQPVTLVYLARAVTPALSGPAAAGGIDVCAAVAGDRSGQRSAHRDAVNARIASGKTPLALAGGVYFLLWLAVLAADRLWPLPLHDVTPARVVVAEDGTPLWRFADAQGVWRYRSRSPTCRRAICRRSSSMKTAGSGAIRGQSLRGAARRPAGSYFRASYLGRQHAYHAGGTPA